MEKNPCNGAANYYWTGTGIPFESGDEIFRVMDFEIFKTENEK